eukprot:IDg16083t1
MQVGLKVYAVTAHELGGLLGYAPGALNFLIVDSSMKASRGQFITLDRPIRSHVKIGSSQRGSTELPQPTCSSDGSVVVAVRR